MNNKKLHTGIFLGTLFFVVAIFIVPHLSHAATTVNYWSNGTVSIRDCNSGSYGANETDCAVGNGDGDNHPIYITMPDINEGDYYGILGLGGSSGSGCSGTSANDCGGWYSPFQFRQTLCGMMGMPCEMTVGVPYTLTLYDQSQAFTVQVVHNADDSFSYTSSDNIPSGPPPPPPASVALNFPTDGTTSPDFSNWVVGWSGDVPYGEMHVVYGMSSLSLNYDDHIDFSPVVSANPLPIYKSQPLFFIPLAIPATWYAQVMDVGATETVFSNIVSFQINPNFANPTSNSTDTTLAGPFLGVGGGETSSTIPNPTTNCQYTSSSFLSDPIGNIQNGICNAFVFLFIPNGVEQTALNTQFTNTWTQISNRVPFGYAGIIMTAFQSFKEGATTSTLITSSTYHALSSVLDPLKTGISFMLILLLAFAILHFVRNITL